VKVDGKVVKMEKDLLDDMKLAIEDQLRKGKGCGGLRMSDSHERRMRYFFEFWKSEFVHGGIERRRIVEDVEKQRQDEKKKQMLDEVKNVIDKFSKEGFE
jgi:hypothetical protein